MLPAITQSLSHFPRLLAGVCVLLPALHSGCIQVKTEPIRIEPIYIEITVNHRIQRELDDFFGELDAASQATQYRPLED